MFGLRMGAMGRVGAGLTLPQQAINILRRPGLESHVYMPGVGWVNGLSLTNATMEDGTQAASVDNPMGYMGDPIATLGAELVTNGGFSADASWTKGTGWTISDGVATHAAGSTSELTQAVSLTAGKSYQITYTVSGYSGTGGVSPRFNGGTVSSASVLSANGTYTQVVTAATGNNTLAFNVVSTATLSIDNISVRELVGAIPARQATTANKPILRRGAVNRATQSENILAAAGYGVNGGGTLTRNQTAPNGTTTASLFTEGVTAAAAHFITNPTTTFTFNAGVSYTQTWYVKAGTATRCQITFPSAPFGSAQYANFSLTGAGSVLASAGGTASIAPDEQGFYRCRFTATCSTTGTGNVAVLAFINSDASAQLPNYTGTDLTLTVWGAQLETGSTASPYIPTTTAAASSNTGPFWAEFDGTDFLSLAAVPFGLNDDFVVVVGASNDQNAANNRVFAAVGSTAVFRINWDTVLSKYTAVFTNDAGASVALPSPAPTIALGQVLVVSLRQSGAAKQLRTNGVAGGVQNAAVGVGTLTSASIGSQGGAVIWRGGIYPVIVVKGTVTDAELATLERWVASLSGVVLP